MPSTGAKPAGGRACLFAELPAGVSREPSPMGLEWQHFTSQDQRVPPLCDLEFVRELVAELTTRTYPTGGAGVQNRERRPEPDLCGRLLQRWRNGVAVAELRSVGPTSTATQWSGKALDPEKSDRYRRQLAGSRAGAGGGASFLCARHRGTRLPAAVHTGGDSASEHAALEHVERNVDPQRNALPARPLLGSSPAAVA